MKIKQATSQIKKLKNAKNANMDVLIVVTSYNVTNVHQGFTLIFNLEALKDSVSKIAIQFSSRMEMLEFFSMIILPEHANNASLDV